ncbi:MAG: methyltransferase domain-containing protein [Anaerolineae bacterium]|nr:methyltransferase domain-containing protein [Caldilineales bacterium]MDW8268129.1 methyltransferase domain-containing protein [Anaerolineae bacterium]
MKLQDIQANWDKFGANDPLWSILAWPDKSGHRWQIEEFFATGVREIAEVLATVAALGLSPERGRALDFGCGVGRLTQALAEHFAEVDGVDISQAMLTLAAHYNRHGARCRYHLNETADLTRFGDGTFDFVYSSITLQHMPPRFARAYLREFLRVLKPQGVLVFQLPDRPRQWHRRLIQRLRPTRLFRLYQRLRHGDRPVMDMFGIPRPQVVAWLTAHGGHVVAVQPDDSADRHWTSFRYIVTKNVQTLSV